MGWMAGVGFLVGANFFLLPSVQTSPKAHPASYPGRIFPPVKWAGGMKLTTDHSIVLILEMVELYLNFLKK
jgi:hypothetical protein